MKTVAAQHCDTCDRSPHIERIGYPYEARAHHTPYMGRPVTCVTPPRFLAPLRPCAGCGGGLSKHDPDGATCWSCGYIRRTLGSMAGEP
jgi:hypothetical protein